MTPLQRARAQGKAPKRIDSAIEALFAIQLRIEKAPAHERNYRFMPGRKLEFDFCWPDIRAAVEVQGMVHRIKGRFQADIEKRALAILAGWKVLEVDGQSIRDGRAIGWAMQLLSRHQTNKEFHAQ